MIKIKLECWWTDSHSINTRMIRQFVSDDDLTNYSFVTENPDFTIVFGKTNWDKIETPKENTFYISQEPLWSPNQPKDGIHDYCSKILIIIIPKFCMIVIYATQAHARALFMTEFLEIYLLT